MKYPRFKTKLSHLYVLILVAEDELAASEVVVEINDGAKTDSQRTSQKGIRDLHL